MPGCAFFHDETQPTPYVRASYSLSSEEEMDKVLQSFIQSILLKIMWLLFQGFERLNALIIEENLKGAS